MTSRNLYGHAASLGRKMMRRTWGHLLLMQASGKRSTQTPRERNVAYNKQHLCRHKTYPTTPCYGNEARKLHERTKKQLRKMTERLADDESLADSLPHASQKEKSPCSSVSCNTSNGIYSCESWHQWFWAHRSSRIPCIPQQPQGFCCSDQRTLLGC